MALQPNPLVAPVTPSEVAYASPLYSSSSSSQATRSRRSNRSSSDSSVSDWSGLFEEDLRAGGPNLPDLPCESIPLPYNHPFRESRGLQGISELTRGVRQLCDSQRMNLAEVDFYGRRSIYAKAATPTLTCLIFARKRTPDEKWIHIARDVRRFLHQRGAINLAVELIDPKILEGVRLMACPSTDPIYSKWNHVRHEILDNIPLLGINMISCFRIGARSGPPNFVSTVVLGVDHDTVRNWKEAREDVLKILGRHSLNTVAVLIRKDSHKTYMETYRGPTLDRFTSDGTAHIGQSLSPHAMKHPRGTLGGYVQLRNPDRGDWVTFALTCCHCVLPMGKDVALSSKEAQLVHKWKVSGVQVADKEAAATLRVDSPSQDELISRINYFDEEIKKAGKDESYQRVKTAKELDDFVIPPDERKYRNTQIISDLEKARDPINKLYQNRSFILGNIFAASDAIPQGHDLRKVGHATGVTDGYYNGLLQTNIAKDHKTGKNIITHEHTMLNANRAAGINIIASGDSGCLVHDANGEVQGICFGGNQQGDVAFFTHISDLIADIKEVVTGLKEIRLLGES
ncbi:hypothetical protein N8T08_003008 [Aspergillus melleus]|uniref:Uncharacterized protein n=1 Tax=Aspergillus melleus TaxID=138277 RepID=A0ACC3B8N2_9EURO|nr:hypothetical protein N8T08_003008 [Aspergillus melleus]